jgi:hypothetical protein
VVLNAQDGFGQFRLAVALDTGDGENLALGDVEADPVHHVGAIGCPHGQVLHHERGFFPLCRGLIKAQAHGAANHHGGQFSG